MPLVYGGGTGTGGLVTTGGTITGDSWAYVGTTTGSITLNHTVMTTNSTLIYCAPLTQTGNPGYDCPADVVWPQPQVYIRAAQPPERPVLTAEERAEYRRRADELRAENLRQARQRETARLRARDRAAELLMSVLSAEQAHSYTRDGWFEVRGSDGGLFRVHRRGQAGNVEEIIGGRAVARLCCHPPGGLPDADAHLAQLLHIETDERGFRQTANRTALWQPPAAA